MATQPYKYLGIWIYPLLPPGMKVASQEDFFQDGNLLMGMDYLIHSYHADEFQAYKVNSNFSLEKIAPWLNDNRIYIKQQIS